MSCTYSALYSNLKEGKERKEKEKLHGNKRVGKDKIKVEKARKCTNVE